MNAVEAQQMGVGLDRAEIVDRDDLDVRAAGFDDGAQDVAPDAPEAVDRNLYRHRLSPPICLSDSARAIRRGELRIAGLFVDPQPKV